MSAAGHGEPGRQYRPNCLDLCRHREAHCVESSHEWHAARPKGRALTGRKVDASLQHQHWKCSLHSSVDAGQHQGPELKFSDCQPSPSVSSTGCRSGQCPRAVTPCQGPPPNTSPSIPATGFTRLLYAHPPAPPARSLLLQHPKRPPPLPLQVAVGSRDSSRCMLSLAVISRSGPSGVASLCTQKGMGSGFS